MFDEQDDSSCITNFRIEGTVDSFNTFMK